MPASAYRRAMHRKGKSKAPRNNGEDYRQLFESSPIPMWVHDAKTLAFLTVNDAAIRHYGYSRQEFLAMKMPAILSGKESLWRARKLDAAIGGQNLARHSRHRKKNGELIDVEVMQQTLRFATRAAKLVLAWPASGAAPVANELCPSEKYYRQMFDNAAQGIWVVNYEGKTTMANRCLAEILGYPLDEMLGASWFALMDEDGREESRRKLERLKDGIPGHHDLKFIRKDGTPIYASLCAWPKKDASGQFTGAVAFVADATKRKKAEEDLRASERQLRAVFEGSLEAMVIANDEDRFLDANPAACELFGSLRHELIGRRMAEFSERAVDFHRLWRAALEFGRRKGEFRLVRRDGGVREVEFSAVAEVIPGRHLSVLHDITERKRAEQTLREISGRLLRAQDEERRDIARELHDSTAQSLSALVMNLSAVRKSAVRLDQKARQAFAASVGLAQQCARELRSISYLLHPPLLEDLGLISALRHYMDGYTRRSGVRVKLEVGREMGRLPQEIELALYRVVQESLTNLHPRAGITMARIRLMRQAQAVTLEVRKHSRGISTLTRQQAELQDPKAGVGIAGVQERLKQLGGQLETIFNMHDTTVRATLPLKMGDL